MIGFWCPTSMTFSGENRHSLDVIIDIWTKNLNKMILYSALDATTSIPRIIYLLHGNNPFGLLLFGKP